MMTRTLFMQKYPNFVEGMTVRSTDGEKLGTVTQLEDDYMTVEKGFFFPKDFTIRYDDISTLRDGEIILSHATNDLSDWKDESYKGWSDMDSIGSQSQANTLGLGSVGLGSNSFNSNSSNKDVFNKDTRSSTLERQHENNQEDVRILVAEELLEAKKTTRNKGEVKVRKVVHTEFKTITVPVTKEELRIERNPVRDQDASGFSDSEISFKDDKITIPLKEEEIEVDHVEGLNVNDTRDAIKKSKIA